MTAIAPVITIDCPSGAGKGTLCKAMAEALQWHLLDSANSIAYWHWWHHITMLMLRQKMRWYRWHPIWMYVLCQPMAIWK